MTGHCSCLGKSEHIQDQGEEIGWMLVVGEGEQALEGSDQEDEGRFERSHNVSHIHSQQEEMLLTKRGSSLADPGYPNRCRRFKQRPGKSKQRSRRSRRSKQRSRRSRDPKDPNKTGGPKQRSRDPRDPGIWGLTSWLGPVSCHLGE